MSPSSITPTDAPLSKFGDPPIVKKEKDAAGLPLPLLSSLLDALAPPPPPPAPSPSLHRASSPNGPPFPLVPPSSSFDLPQLALTTTTAGSYPDLTPTDQAALVLHHLSRIPPSSPPNSHQQLSDEYLHEDGEGGPSGSYGRQDDDDNEQGLVELSLQQQQQDALDEQDALLDEHDQQEVERYDDLAYGEPGASRPRAGAGTGRGGAPKKAKKVKLDLGDAGRKEGKRAQVKVSMQPFRLQQCLVKIGEVGRW